MVPNGQNVKSGEVLLTDGHERARNFLSDGEMDGLLAAARKGRHGVRDFLILLMGASKNDSLAGKTGVSDFAAPWRQRINGGLRGDVAPQQEPWRLQRGHPAPPCAL